MLWGGKHTINKKNPIHAHDMHEVVVCLNSNGYQVIEDQKFRFKKGRIFFLPEHSHHYVEGTLRKASSIFYTCFDSNLFSSKGMHEIQTIVTYLKEKHVYESGTQNYLLNENLSLSKKIFDEFTENGLYANERALYLLAELLINFYRSLTPNKAHVTSLDKSILSICKEIQKNPTLNFTLSESAQKCHMSRTTFANRFKKEVGLSFIDYIHRIRLSKARDLLINTNHSITEIALQSGFQHLGHFHKAFKKMFLTSPKKFREWSQLKGPFLTLYKETK